MKNRIIAFILALTSLFMCTVSVFADDSVETFISEVALVYEDSVEEARAAIAGTDWKLYEFDLNDNADVIFDDGVYLIYKTTTNVEEAITDLRVMDMYGGYSSGNYQQQLDASRDSYKAVIKELTVAIDEFKTLYNEGNEMAKVAYRQLNYYKDMKVSATSDESDMLMGDFLFNVPSEAAFVQVLLEGNTAVISNILSLIAVGISGSSDSCLTTRVEEQYKNAANLTDAVYYDTASKLYEILKPLHEDVIKYDELKDKFKPDSEEISEEEYIFTTQLLPIVSALETIKLGDKTLCDIVREGTYTVQTLYPVAAALTNGQNALVNAGLFELVLKYAKPKALTQEFYDEIENEEKKRIDENGNFVPVNVYFGVDRTIFEGSFAMTSEAERSQAIDDRSRDFIQAYDEAEDFRFIASLLLRIDGAYLTTLAGLFLIGKVIQKFAAVHAIAMSEVVNSSFLMFFIKTATAIKTSIIGLVWVAIGVALVALGVTIGGTIYQYYNPNYTEIPNIMIDVRESDFGDRYVRYDVAKVYGDEDGRNADFNAYEGKEWIALYYTKDANAGNCLTPNFKLSNDSDKVTRRHQGVSMFGESSAFNLNSHVYDSDAPKLYLSIRYSNTKKAAADVPEVVGSMVSQGAIYAIVALTGVGTGAGGAVVARLIWDKRKKQKNSTETPENS